MITIEQARALTGHTEGPWTIKPNPEGDFGINGPNGIEVVWGCGCCRSPSTDNENNIPLIAASPDLLALALSQADEIERLRSALQLFVTYDDCDADNGAQMMLAYAAAIEAARAALKEPKP